MPIILQVPTPSNLIGDMSPHYLAVALNTAGLSFVANSDALSALTVIIARMGDGILDMGIRVSVGFANNESLALEVSYTSLNGSVVLGPSVVLDDTNTPSGGGEVRFAFEKVIPVGSVVNIDHIHTAGGQANNPRVTILAQFY